MPGPVGNDGMQSVEGHQSDSPKSRRLALPDNAGSGQIAWWNVRFRDAALERAFQQANMAGTRQYLVVLAGAGIVGALLTVYGSWMTLPTDSPAFLVGAAWRVVLAITALGVIILARTVKQPWELYACNALVLSIGCVAIALRSSLPGGPEVEATVFHVTQNGLTLLLIVTMAQLVLVPGWFVVNACISATALVSYLAVMNIWPAPPADRLDVSSVAFIGFLFILGMGYSAQRLRRVSYFSRIQLQEANRQLNQLATLDHLTGCANRRHFYTQAEAELSRSRRYSREMGLVIMDVDHFKPINDRFGHAAGDAVLQTLADTISEELRELDVLGRVGGEEFALLLPETPRREAVAIAERLRRRLAGLVIEHEGEQLSLTASFGVTAREPGDTSVDAIMRRADRALYEAKAGGRNRTAVSDSDRTASIAQG